MIVFAAGVITGAFLLAALDIGIHWYCRRHWTLKTMERRRLEAIAAEGARTLTPPSSSGTMGA